MKIITRDDLKVLKSELMDKIRNGSVFIHPTDTIYGIGCNALNEAAVKKIRDLKGRPDTPFSVIAPGKEWIREHCKSASPALLDEWLEKLPGPYTLILKTNKSSVVAKETNKGMGTLGVRIPNHWFSSLVEEADVPVITTSANKVGNDFMTSLDDLDSEIKQHIDFILYEGEKIGRPSKLVNLSVPKTEIIER